jgi:hypothetical protein
MKFLTLLPTTMALTACVTLKGNYEVKAVDASGKQINTGMVMTATGSRIYTVRNALCRTYPQAKIIITDMQTRQELASESPFQCK